MEKFIIELVKENNRVIIPNFGAFIISKENGINILFNNFLSFNDGLLINFVAEQKGIDTVLATEEVFSFVDKLKKDLDETGEYQIKNLGVFKKDKNGILRFFKDPNFIDIYKEETKIESLINPLQNESIKEDLLDIDSTDDIVNEESNSDIDVPDLNEEENSGMPQEPVLTIDSEETEENKVEEKENEDKSVVESENTPEEENSKKEEFEVSAMLDNQDEEVGNENMSYEEDNSEENENTESYFPTDTKTSRYTLKEKKNKNSIIILVALLVITLGIVAYVFIFHKPSKDKTKKAHEIKIEQQKPMEKDTIPKEQPVVEEIKKPEIEKIDDKFFIIVGGFKEEQNAINLVDKLQKKGYEKAHIIEKGSFHMVSIDSDVSFKKMEKRQQEILGTEKMDTWIYQEK